MHVIHWGCEHTHTIGEEPYVLYAAGVESPIPFQEAQSFSYTLYIVGVRTSCFFWCSHVNSVGVGPGQLVGRVLDL